MQFDKRKEKQDCSVAYEALKGDNLCEEYMATVVLLGCQIAARGTVT